MELLLAHHSPVIDEMVRRMYRRWWCVRLDPEDLRQDACEALVRAYRAGQIAPSSPPGHVARTCLNGMVDGQRRMRAMGGVYHKNWPRAARLIADSLDAQPTWVAQLAEPSFEAELVAHVDFWRAVDGLDPAGYAVIFECVYLGRTQLELAVAWGISQGRISQIKAAALRKVAARLAA